MRGRSSEVRGYCAIVTWFRKKPAYYVTCSVASSQSLWASQFLEANFCFNFYATFSRISSNILHLSFLFYMQGLQPLFWHPSKKGGYITEKPVFQFWPLFPPHFVFWYRFLVNCDKEYLCQNTTAETRWHFPSAGTEPRRKWRRTKRIGGQHSSMQNSLSVMSPPPPKLSGSLCVTPPPIQEC